MAINANMHWDVRTTGNDANGGGFDPVSGTPGTDYSQQAAAQVTYTDLAIDAALNTKVTSAATPFTSAHVGNVINVTAGTGFTVGRYQVNSVASGAATLDRAVGTTSSTGGVGKLGGSLASLGYACGIVTVSANIIHVKSGSYNCSTTSNVANGRCNPSSGVSVIGYQTAHFDNAGRAVLIPTSSYPFGVIYPAASAYTANIEVNNTTGDYASITGYEPQSGATVVNCRAVKCKSIGFSSGAANNTFYNCEAYQGGSGFYGGGVTAKYFNCVARGNTSHGFYDGFSSNFNCVNCYSLNNTGAGWSVGNGSLFNCVAHGNGSHGFFYGGTMILIRCISSGNAGWQYSGPGTAHPHAALHDCAVRSGGSGTFNAANASQRFGTITLTADPFTNAAGLDFTLNALAGGGPLLKALGFAFLNLSTTSYPDVGPSQAAGAAAAPRPIFGSYILKGA